MRFLEEDDFRRKVWERCESPIEQILCTALFVDLGMAVVPDGYPLRDFVTEQPRAFLFSQYRIAGYRLDFLVIVANRENTIAFAIECDGKRYHSSDQQQAYDEERDAALERAGIFAVWRFTGSEIVSFTREVVRSIADRLAKYGVESRRPEDLLWYGALRDQFCAERWEVAARRQRGRARSEVSQTEQEFEEELAAIRREDATWM